MRFKAILAEEARKRYPLSIFLMVLGVLVIPFSYLFVRFGLELTSTWWSILGVGVGVIVGGAMIGLGSLVEDIHDISMHTVGFDLELGDEMFEDYDEEEMPDEDVDAPESEHEEGAPAEEAKAPEENPSDAG